MKLAELTQGRDNNFNLIRVIAASAVLFAHSYGVSGDGEEPFPLQLGTDIGSIAVDAFFITSGLLVTSSLLARRNMIEFAWARILRIYPALLVMLLLTVFVLGPLLTSFPLSAYFAAPDTFRYLWRSAILFMGIDGSLPGLFTWNPMKNTVNGSLWTMPIEVRLYAVLAILWGVLGVAGRFRLKAFDAAVFLLIACSGLRVFYEYFHTQDLNKVHWLYLMFFCGAASYLLRNHIPISRMMFLAAAAVLLGSALLGKKLFFVCYVGTFAYILLFLAYVPAGFIRRYNRVGDYSYGIYIFAYPVQQSIVALLPGISAALLSVTSAAISLALAVLSWHFVEKRALRLKGFCVRVTLATLRNGEASLSARLGFARLSRDAREVEFLKPLHEIHRSAEAE